MKSLTEIREYRGGEECAEGYQPNSMPAIRYRVAASEQTQVASALPFVANRVGSRARVGADQITGANRASQIRRLREVSALEFGGPEAAVTPGSWGRPRLNLAVACIQCQAPLRVDAFDGRPGHIGLAKRIHHLNSVVGNQDSWSNQNQVQQEPHEPGDCAGLHHGPNPFGDSDHEGANSQDYPERPAKNLTELGFQRDWLHASNFDTLGRNDALV